ncbi:MAG: hypothetical protein K2K81_02735, partial [Muribaculaceae bacterium]|nr:hypothetical protein [Muribaculaceae bacterium]
INVRVIKEKILGMKKIYSVLAVAALVSVSASAEKHGLGPQEKQLFKLSEKVFKLDNSKHATTLSVTTSNLQSTRAGVNDILGIYAWEGYNMLAPDEYSDPYGWELGSFSVEADETNPSSLLVSGLTTAPINATYNAATGELSIPSNQITGLYNDGQGTTGTKRFVHAAMVPALDENGKPLNDANGNPMVDDEGNPLYMLQDQDTPLVMKYDAERGGFVLDRLDVIEECVVNAQGKTLGYFILCRQNTTLKYPEKLSNQGWKDYGFVPFTDGWVATLFMGVTEELATWNVKVQQSTTNANLIRLVNPYGNENTWSQIKNYNESPIEGSILIDITDHNCVMALPNVMAPAGFILSEVIPGMMYCYSDAGYFFEDSNQNAESEEDLISYKDMIEALGTENIGQIEGNVLTIYNCSFGFGDCLNMMANTGWSDDSGELIEMTSKVILPDALLSGVNDVLVDNTNAPVKYYNLQGMEVANPEAGQLVIKKQGSKSTKLIVK